MNALAHKRDLAPRSLLLALVMALGALALWGAAGAPKASAELSFCPPGSGPGQCSSPQGLATDLQTARLYVADQENSRVNVFDATDGEFLSSFGSSGTGAGQLAGPRWIAVDNVEGSPTRHHVYVVDSNGRVSHFEADGTFVGAFGWGVDTGVAALQTCTTASECQKGTQGAGECQLAGAYKPVSVGPGGNVFMVANSGNEPNFTVKVAKFSPAGACLDEWVLRENQGRFQSLAVDSAEDIYAVATAEGQELKKYALGPPPNSAPLCDLDDGIGTWSIGLDGAGHLFAAQSEPRLSGGSHKVVTEYDAACGKVRRFGYDHDQAGLNADGLAAYHGPSGDVFLSLGSEGIDYISIPPPGPIAIASQLKVSPGNAQADLSAAVNPEGEATNVLLEYASDAEFDKDLGEGGDGFEGPGTGEESKALPIPAGREFRENTIEFLLGCEVASEEAIANGECLLPETEYHVRLKATNGSGADEVSGTFTTKDALEAEVFATGVDTTAATINAMVNPLGIPASGHFEYVSDADYQRDIEEGGDGFANATRVPTESEIDFGSGEAPVKGSRSLYPLPEATVYHYRLVALNGLIAEPLLSEEQTFTTYAKPSPFPCPANEAFRSGAGALLPDCRAFELVSPLDKANGDIVVMNQVLTGVPAVVTQGAGSGERLTYGSYRAFGDAKAAPYTSQYLAARDPAGGWSSHGVSSAEGQLVDQSLIGSVEQEFRAFSEDLCEAWVVPVAEPPLAEGALPGHKNLYRRTDELCGGESYEAITRAQPEKLGPLFLLEPQGSSADGEVTVFAANDSLVGTGAPAQPAGCLDKDIGPCQLRVYVQEGTGEPRYACVLPGGSPHSGSCLAGTGRPQSYGNGRFTNLTNALSADGKRLYWTASEGEGRIYLRENPLGEGAECSGEGAPCTHEVSKDGEEQSGSTSASFRAAAADGSVAFYTTAAVPLAPGDLYRYEAASETSEKLAGGVFGVMGASEDASRVYFASSEALSGEQENSEGDKALAGKPNLYLYDSAAGGSYRFVATLTAADANEVPGPTAREPFRRSSRVSPSGSVAAFTSTASVTGYDNADAASGKPDNEVFLYDAGANGGAGEILCASCNPSGARPVGADLNDAPTIDFWVAARLPGWQTNLHPGRLLSADGDRLFFESQDSLVPRDSNARLDLYQWERAGTGECESTLPTYSAQAKGCIDLITSGKSSRDSLFVDASSNGDDVFFTTLSGLLPEDYGLTDVYDARIGGGFPSPPPPEPECEGETCQSPAAAPEPRTPATATYEGPGNLAGQKARARSCPQGKRKVKRRGKVRCVGSKKARKPKSHESNRRASR